MERNAEEQSVGVEREITKLSEVAEWEARRLKEAAAELGVSVKLPNTS